MSCICSNDLYIFSDEKEKYDPVTFSDQIISGLNEAKGDLEQVCSMLQNYFAFPGNYDLRTMLTVGILISCNKNESFKHSSCKKSLDLP